MPAGASIEVRGARELARDFDRAAVTIPPEVRRLEQGAALIVVPLAKRLAPKKSGALERAIKIAGRHNNAIQFGGPTAPHGPVINFGGTLPRHESSQRTRVESQEHIYTAIEIADYALQQHFERGVIRILDQQIGGNSGRRAMARGGTARAITGR